MRKRLQAGRTLAVALLVISGAVLLFAPVAHAIFVIDDFDKPDTAQTYFVGSLIPSTNPLLFQTSDSAIMGGERDLFLDVTGNPGAMIALNGQFGAGDLQVVAQEATDVILQYDGVDADTVGPPPALVDSTMSSTVDLVTDPLGGHDHEAFAFIFSSGGGTFDIEILVQSPDGPDAGTDPDVSTFTGTVAIAAPATGLILFDDEIEFAGDNGWDHPYGLDIPDPSAADFKQVERVEFRVSMKSGAVPMALTLDSIGTRVAIPEPGSMLLLAFGGLCLVGCRRRRRHKA